MGKILISGLRELGVHGVLPEEQSRPQPFEVDVELEVDLVAAGPERRPRRHRRLLRRLGSREPSGEERALPAARAPGDAHRRGVPYRRPGERGDGDGAQAPSAGAGHARPRRGARHGVTRAYLGLGSNLGDRLAHLQLAVDELATTTGVAGRRRVAGVRDRAGRRAGAGRLPQRGGRDRDRPRPARAARGRAAPRAARRRACAPCGGGRARSTSTSCSWATSASTNPISRSRIRAWASAGSCSRRLHDVAPDRVREPGRPAGRAFATSAVELRLP